GLDEVRTPVPSTLSRDETASSTQTVEPTDTSGAAFTRLYDRADARSHVLALLPEEAAINLEGIEGDFARVTTESGLPGYVLRSAPIELQGVAAADHASPPLYEQPDGWPRVLAQLPEGAFVVPGAAEGN